MEENLGLLWGDQNLNGCAERINVQGVVEWRVDNQPIFDLWGCNFFYVGLEEKTIRVKVEDLLQNSNF